MFTNIFKILLCFTILIVVSVGIIILPKVILQVSDKEAPIIILHGDNPQIIDYGKDYVEAGFSVSDDYDKHVETEIVYQKIVDTKKSGEYEIIYKAVDDSGKSTEVIRKVVVGERIIVENGVTYVEGILIVNKKYSIPSNYGSGVDKEAYAKLQELQSSAKKAGYTIKLCSGYRSYASQKKIYNNYVRVYGQKSTDTFSAKPGHSEHQTGLAFDVGKIDDNFGNTKEGKWLAQNAHLYGFIIRYPNGKQAITGYKYEPWHIRYLGVEIATKVYESGLSLEEYLGI